MRLNSQELHLGDFRATFDAALEDWKQGRKVERLWARDADLWTGADEAQWLGWLDVTSRQLEADHEDTLDALSREIADSDFEHAVVLGMGGSSLCPDVLSRTFGQQPGFPKLEILDSTVPDQIRALEERIIPSKTLFVVASKSGTTVEPNAFESYFFDAIGDASQFVAITDPGSPLEEHARSRRYRYVFHGEPAIGGRFSALSNFGMVPAALMGIDTSRFLASAARMVEACGPDVEPADNPGIALGVALGTLAREGRDKLTFVTSERLSSLGSWIEQLVAESTGKRGRGIVPVVDEVDGPPEVYGDDRVFVIVSMDDEEPPPFTAGHPLVRIRIPSVDDLPQEIFRWEMATAVAGALLELNPFDQPDVEASKVKTRALVASFEKSGEVPEDTCAMFPPESAIRSHLATLSPGDYFAIHAYLEMNAENIARLQAFCDEIRERYRVATTIGFGPRFLHSTGQLHKGGPNRGVFVQLTAEDTNDLTIPGRDLTFGLLKRFQAAGDLEVLAERDRRILRVHLGRDVAAGLGRLVGLP